MIYEPAEDSFLLEKEVKKLSKGKKVLDMGTGSAILALAAKNSGAKSVLAADINPKSVELACSSGLRAIRSNLFSKVKGRFDLIVFNPPYLPEDEREDLSSRKVTTGGKNGDEIIIKFLIQSKSHLAKKGEIILLLSSVTPRKKIFSLIKKLKLKKRMISSQKVFFENLEVYLLRKALKTKKST